MKLFNSLHYKGEGKGAMIISCDTTISLFLPQYLIRAIRVYLLYKAV